jgi:hypothetical protein
MSEDRFSIVRSDDDPEMGDQPGLRAVACRCGWRSVWFGAGVLTDQGGDETQVSADQHAELVRDFLLHSQRHARH